MQAAFEDQVTTPVKRGSYRSVQRKPPRQTKHNKKRRVDKEEQIPCQPDPELHEEDLSLDAEEPHDAEPTTLADDEFDTSTSPDNQVEIEQCLFPGSSLTVKASNSVLQTYMCRHYLTHQAKADLLRIMQIFLPDARIPSSLHAFEKHVSSPNSSSPEVSEHHYCPGCKTILSNPLASECPQEKCKIGLVCDKTPYFITVSIAGQLKCLLNRRQFYQSLQYERTSDTHIRDIHDGKQYQNLKASLALEKGNHVTFTLNTDGVVCFRSTNHSFWPVLLMINELPFNERKLPRNMILAGLWFAAEKPPMQTFLKPVCNMLLDIESEGVMVDVPEMDPFRMTAHVICCCVDLPAKALVQNCIQYNGAYGCGYCEQPGESTRTDSGGTIRTFPYEASNEKSTPRTSLSTLNYAREALKTQSSVKGIKGPSWLGCLKSFDIVNGMSPDYMHCSLLGVSRTLLYLWTDKTKSRNTLHDISKDVPLINERMKRIVVPSDIRRKPRGVSEINHWKASEFRSWVLFYALPVLKGILNDEYLNHFALLSEALWLLLQTAPTHTDVSQAERLINHFCYKFSGYYGERFNTANVHQLLHFADCVRHVGPLWAHSAFPFENANGWLGDLFNGTRNPNKQIVKAFLERQKLSVECERLDCDNEDAKDFLKGALATGHRYKVTATVGKGLKALGKLVESSSLSKAEVEILQENSLSLVNCVVHTRLLVLGVFYSSSSYARAGITNDSLVTIISKGRRAAGVIRKFVSCCKDSCNGCTETNFCQNYMLVDTYPTYPFGIDDSITNAEAKHLMRIEGSESLEAYPVQLLQAKCVKIQIDENNYFAELPNPKENNL